ncbi:mitochondrial import inner membrane translocase subunit TIM23-2 [Zea mays]|jgi:mitochondrial import inner membrane translocase subunit TIM23|uniref:Mitochondrial import inner membrane translocase subunit TIM23-3 n=1 Tax=Zea mays TaxID=4577 RepID=A0A1D6JL88_MAIZE|nr:mitochondrial import inner membrane translocase subunit TIM23-2 [Zea mays]ONL92912.1 Mitochondrial import inner membrane translocase subunit TIM23-3 [Zea mays]|eukprot:XP_008650049.1 mitochondrial import inner membrane translocase subunit TIM23-2 [Zea mays]
MADPRPYSTMYGTDDRRDAAIPASASERRLYNPYQDLNMPYRQLYDLPTSPEFLFQEEAAAQRRSWGENLTYYTGVGYLGGAVAGATLGLRDAARGAEPGEPAKIRANRVLNSCGSSGRRVGNTLGVIGLMYAGIESAMVAARDRDDWINSVAAGLGTGALFRAANGPRSAVVAGAVGGVLAGAAAAAKQVGKRYVPAL